MKYRFTGLTYKERQAKRAENKAAKQATTDLLGNTLKRLSAFISVIEAAFKPEADALHMRVVAAWIKAYKICEQHNFDMLEVKIVVTGYDFKKPHEGYMKPGDARYPEWSRECNVRRRAQEAFIGTREDTILAHKLLNVKDLTSYANQQAFKAVEDAKHKLFQSIAKKLHCYQQVTVLDKSFVRDGVKGFQGEFKLQTEQGIIWLETKAVSAQGLVQCFHYRYLAHVKK